MPVLEAGGALAADEPEGLEAGLLQVWRLAVLGVGTVVFASRQGQTVIFASKQGK